MNKEIGSLIKLVDNRNINSKVTNLLGMNIKKEFMPSVANTSQTDLSKYKIIKKGQFAYSSMQTGRDETIRIALYKFDEPAIISPAYSVFEIIDQNQLLPDFVMMYFLRPESDRFGWFISDSSVRASLDWDRFCEIKIPVPKLEDQKKCVFLYQNLLANQQSYEKSLIDLQFICEAYLKNLLNKKQTVKLGQYIPQTDEMNKEIGSLIKLVDNRNINSKVTNLLGMNIKKEFMPSVANTSQTDLSKYKIIKKGQFAYSSMQTGRDETIRIALYKFDEPAIISPAYSVFEIIDQNQLLPDFVMMYFLRPESDRFGWFISDSSVRASLDWDRFCEIKIPVPNIDEQNAIVSLYQVQETRKSINIRLKEIIRSLCPILIYGIRNGLC